VGVLQLVLGGVAVPMFVLGGRHAAPINPE
jgi:hypothetical protein